MVLFSLLQIDPIFLQARDPIFFFLGFSMYKTVTSLHPYRVFLEIMSSFFIAWFLILFQLRTSLLLSVGPEHPQTNAWANFEHSNEQPLH